MLSIDIIEHCNFKCYFCGAKDLTSSSYMDVKVYESIIDQAVPLGFTGVILTPQMGEPFLHPRIYDILNYTTARLKVATLDTNASAIDVHQLKKIDHSKIRIKVSQYGRNVDEFVQLTGAHPRLWGIFNQRLGEMDDAGIDYKIRLRTPDHPFKFADTEDQFPLHDITTKCKFHMAPQIFANGDVTFCRFFRDGFTSDTWRADAVYANVTQTPLAEIMSNPLRYKFYDSQSMCAEFCRTSYCASDFATLTSYKMMANAKRNYAASADQTDADYAAIEERRRSAQH